MDHNPQMPTPARHAPPYSSWMRYFSPTANHRRLGPVCLGVGVQQGVLPVVGPRALDHHVAVVVTRGRGWFSHGGRPPRR